MFLSLARHKRGEAAQPSEVQQWCDAVGHGHHTCTSPWRAARRPVSRIVRLAEVSFSGWIISSSAALAHSQWRLFLSEQPSSQSTLGVTRIQPVSCAYMPVWKCYNWKKSHKWFSKLQVGAIWSALKSRRVDICIMSIWNCFRFFFLKELFQQIRWRHWKDTVSYFT